MVIIHIELLASIPKELAITVLAGETIPVSIAPMNIPNKNNISAKVFLLFI
ncbi:hypothetical protein D3C81_2274610 [compost metagenome]